MEDDIWIFFFFFQAEDGIRDGTVTGVQTCALPISHLGVSRIFVGCECRVPSVAKNRAVMFATCCRDRLVTVGHRLRLVRSAPLTRRAMVHPLAKALSGNHLSRG